MRHPPGVSAVAVRQPASKPPTQSPGHSRRLVVLVAALLLIAGVSTARLVGLHRQLNLSHVISPFAGSGGGLAGCKPLDKSHVDLNFYNPDVCLTQDQVLEIIKQLVFTAADAFESHNATYFLDSGTLLGAFRDQKVIPHDNDADVGIDAPGLNYLQHNTIDFPLEYAFTVWNSSLYPDSDRDDKLPARLIHRKSGIYLDVFAFLDWTDPRTGAPLVGPLPSECFLNCVGCPRIPGAKVLRVYRGWIYPLVNCTLEGRSTLKCPHKTQQYLRYTFGKKYMTPDKEAAQAVRKPQQH